MTEVTHAAAIAVAKLKASGPVDQPVQALLDLIEEMERQADDMQIDLHRLREVESRAQAAVEYHFAGNAGSHNFDPRWDADEMLRRLDHLSDVLP